MREAITCSANEGKTYTVVFDGDEVVSVDVIQTRNGADFGRRVWTRGRGSFGTPLVERAKAAARGARRQQEAA